MQLAALSKNERIRYSRQTILPEVGEAGQLKLKNASVLVVGAGGLGCPVVTYLAAAGVGTIKVADSDIIDPTNLHRQPLFKESAIGRVKVEEVARTISELNSSVHLIPIKERVRVDNIREILAKVDLVVDGSDNFATKYLLNDACVEMRKTLISGSIFCFEGQVSVFNAKVGATRGPTYRCIFPEPPPAELVPSCAEAGVLGALPGIIGSLQAAEALKIILRIGESLSGRLLLFDALSMSFRELAFLRNESIASETVIRSAAYYQGLERVCYAKVPSISPSELRSKLAGGEPITLIDVREPADKIEYDIGGVLIPSGELLQRVDEIPQDRTVVLYCRSGVRSHHGVLALSREYGLKNLVNLKGGVLAWMQAEKSVVIE